MPVTRVVNSGSSRPLPTPFLFVVNSFAMYGTLSPLIWLQTSSILSNFSLAFGPCATVTVPAVYVKE